MTEYWVSQPKHYCKFCKVWVANNRPSIQHHEMGKRHKEAVEIFFKDKREARLQGAMTESDLDKQLREIERAALEQAEADAEHFGGSSSGPSKPPPPPPRPPATGRLQPPPLPPPRRDNTVGYKKDEEEEARRAAEEAEKAKEKEDDGKYTVGDVTYLDGKKHEALIIKGMLCEVWVEAEDRWIENAKILHVHQIAVPNTTMIIRKIKVSYRLHEEDEEDVVEEDITSDRIRLIDSVKEPEAPEPPPVDEHTGMGGWQTVSVRVVDVEAEKRAAEEAALILEMERREEEKKRRMQMMVETMEGEDAMSSYDPHGKGVYKGVDLSAGTTPLVTAADIDLGGDKDGPVAFKKRKVMGGGSKAGGEKNNKAKFRRKRSGDDDDD